jgi:hypothetical protein
MTNRTNGYFTSIVFTHKDIAKVDQMITDLEDLAKEFGAPAEYEEQFEGLVEFLRERVEQAWWPNPEAKS